MSASVVYSSDKAVDFCTGCGEHINGSEPSPKRKAWVAEHSKHPRSADLTIWEKLRSLPGTA